jgi:hypothetical protein
MLTTEKLLELDRQRLWHPYARTGRRRGRHGTVSEPSRHAVERLTDLPMYGFKNPYGLLATFARDAAGG